MTFQDRLRGWLKEPLVHFLIGGLVIYLLFAWRGEEVDPASRTIEISREDKARVSLGFERLMGRAPTDAELDLQTQRFVREEVLYREALRLGLDGDDAVVRRRLAQKMDLIAASQAESANPTDEALEEWYKANPARFAEDARYSFEQVFKLDADGAAAVLGQLSRGADAQGLSDPISLSKALENANRKQVLDQFGEQFAKALDQLELGETWQGPVQSGLGWHVVRLTAREPGKVPPLDEVREDVANDWRSSTIEKRKDEAYQLLREQYDVEIAQ